MKRTLLPLMLLAIMVASAACASAAPTAAPYEMPRGTAVAGLPFAGGAAPAMPESLAQSSDMAKAEAPPQPATTNRLVIKNADLSIVVKDVSARVTAIQNMTVAMGGFVVSANVYQTTTRDGNKVPQAQMVVRVPVGQLDAALDQIKSDTVEVQNESQSGQDVTDQYVDLQSRLKAKQAAEAQLLEIMKDAKRTEDVLSVYSQLQQIESDIEVLKGQIKYTEQSAALSAISISIVAEETIKPIEVGGWKPQGVARDALQSLIYFWQDFIDFMIRFVLLILPVLITIAIPFYLAFLVLRWLFRKLRKPKVASPPEAPKKN
jgi:hypothetical protein